MRIFFFDVLSKPKLKITNCECLGSQVMDIEYLQMFKKMLAKQPNTRLMRLY